MKRLIALLILLAACRGERATGNREIDLLQPAAPRRASSVIAAQDSGMIRAAPSAPQPEAIQMPRMIVRTAEVRILAADTARTIRTVTAAVESMGGYVAGSNVWREKDVLRARLTLRVPAAKLDPALASIRSAAKRVENETTTSDDVSQEFVDLAAQLRNLEATEVELRELLTDVRRKTRRASDVLEVHQQLMQIRGQIEQTRGRMRYLTQVSALSSIALEIVPDAIAQPVVEPGWQPLVVARSAGRALVRAMQRLVDAAIWVLVYAMPIAALLCGAAWTLWKLLRRERRVTAA